MYKRQVEMYSNNFGKFMTKAMNLQKDMIFSPYQIKSSHINKTSNSNQPITNEDNKDTNENPIKQKLDTK